MIRQRVYVKQFSATHELICSAALLAWTITFFPFRLLWTIIAAIFGGSKLGYDRNKPKHRSFLSG
jgi:predicted membrane protein